MSLEDKNYLEDENGIRYYIQDVKSLIKTQESLAEALRLEYNENTRGAALEALKLALTYPVVDEDSLVTAARYKKFLVGEDSSDSE